MDGFKKLKSLGILFGVILAALGIVLLIFPDKVINLMATLVGLTIVIFGGFRLLTYFLNRNSYETFPAVKVFSNVAVLLAGLYILMHPHLTTGFVCVVIGLFAIDSSFDRFSVASQRRKAGFKVGSTIGFGLVHLLFGILMIAMPLIGASMIMMVAGLYLLIAGVMVILSTCYFFDL